MHPYFARFACSKKLSFDHTSLSQFFIHFACVARNYCSFLKLIIYAPLLRSLCLLKKIELRSYFTQPIFYSFRLRCSQLLFFFEINNICTPTSLALLAQKN